jgi:hypothetical protein
MGLKDREKVMKLRKIAALVAIPVAAVVIGGYGLGNSSSGAWKTGSANST